MSPEDRKLDAALKQILPRSYNSFPRRHARAVEVLNQWVVRHPQNVGLPPGGADEFMRLHIADHPNPPGSVLAEALRESRSESARNASRQAGYTRERDPLTKRFKSRIVSTLNKTLGKKL